jgi:hypothetical protein
MAQKTGTSATLSIIAAVASFPISLTGHAIAGLIIAIISLPLGLFGLVRAASPRVSGGIISILAIILGGIGVAVAVLVLVGVILAKVA